MSKSISLFSPEIPSTISGVMLKSHLLKKQIISSLANEPLLTVAELSQKLNVSTPTITKLIGELVNEGYIRDMGKIETAGGRRPVSFALNDDSGYFLGIEVANGAIRFALCDMNSNIVKHTSIEDVYSMSSTDTIDKIVEHIDNAIKEFGVDRNKILGQGITVRGRVDSVGGYSYNFLNMGHTPLSTIMYERTGIRTIIENDTRAVAFTEYVMNGDAQDENRLFIYADKGIGVGIIIGGKLYYGKSGFSGEFGHIPFFDNQIICHCGKKGCLETEASGVALENALTKSIKDGRASILTSRVESGEKIEFTDIVAAANNDDVLCIELLAQIGEKLGRGIGVLMNLFNPDSIVIGGGLAAAGDYLLLPVRTALAKYSLSLVNNDSELRLSNSSEIGGVVGAALLTRHHILCEEM